MKLREIRFIRELTQKKLSKWSGINQATLSHIERGLQIPTSEQKEAIAKALQISQKAITWEDD